MNNDPANRAVNDQLKAAEIAKKNPNAKLIEASEMDKAKKAQSAIFRILNQYDCVAIPEITISSFGVSRVYLNIVPKSQLEARKPLKDSAIIESEGGQEDGG